MTARAALWLSPLVAAATAWCVVDSAREQAVLASGIERLAAADPVASAVRFETLAATRRHGARARAGLRVARALGGHLAGAPDALPAPSEVVWAAEDGLPPGAVQGLGLSLVGLMDAALRAGRVDVVEQLAHVAQDGEPASRALYLAAAHLERGDDDAARTLADAAPALFAATALGLGVTEALGWRARGVRTLVRDRRGALLGALDAAGQFEPRDATAAACVPAPAQEALARARPAPSVRLSLDRRLCALALEALGARRGTVVLLDPWSGGLLAAVSDARTLRREPLASFTQLREPASVAKLVTTTAVLRAGLDPDGAIRGTSCLGAQRYADGTLWCPARARPLHGLAHALAISCNLAFADLAQAIGRDALLAEYRRYGFAVEPFAVPWADADGQPDDSTVSEDAAAADGGGEPIPLEPGGADGLSASAAVLLPFGADARVLQATGGERQLADLAIGLQDLAVTPLFGARLAAVFAHGRLPEVALLAAADGVLGRSPQPFPPRAAPAVFDAAWLPLLWPSMQAVAEWGTAAGVAPPGFPVAMKTGTASEWRVGYHSNYVGVGPLPQPLIAFSVRVTHHPTSPSSGRAAREVTMRLLAGLEGLQREGALTARVRR